MGTRGCFLTDEEASRIVKLLADTDMTLVEIGQRMGYSRSAISAINQRFNVRRYSGKKLWPIQINPDFDREMQERVKTQ